MLVICGKGERVGAQGRGVAVRPGQGPAARAVMVDGDSLHHEELCFTPHQASENRRGAVRSLGAPLCTKVHQSAGAQAGEPRKLLQSSTKGYSLLPLISTPEGGCMALYDVWRVWLYGCMRCMRCIA